jgi:hypothetical protein
MIDGKIVASKTKSSKSRAINLENLFLDVTNMYLQTYENNLIPANTEKDKPKEDTQTTGGN